MGGETLAVHTACVNEAEAMLDAGAAVGNFGEVIFAQLLLFLETEGAMIRGNYLQMIVREALPEFFLVPLFAERWSENVLRALEARGVHIFKRKIKILRTGLREYGQAAIARFAALF